jgi:hypothetical protein
MYTNDEARTSALGFASRGYGVFPIHGIIEKGEKHYCTCGDAACGSQGKHPFQRLAPHGLKDATSDLDKIRAWPTGLNYAVVTDRLLVIDIDPRHGGDKSWKELSRKTTRHIPYTWQTRTGGDGEHVIFNNPGGIRCGKLAKGVDVKGVGGYIVGPGCAHISGKRYQWAPACSPKDAPLAEPPEWLLDEIGKTQSSAGERRPPEFWDALIEDGFVNGNRNNAFTSLFGHLIGCGVDPAIAWQSGRCINLCSPEPLDEAELSAIFNRIQASEVKKRGL